MARNHKTNPITEVLDLVSLLPWWAGVTIAVVSYLFLHRLATPVQITEMRPGQISHVVIQSMITGLASVGQYLLPILSIAGAAMSFFRRQHRAALVKDVAHAQSASALDGMSWREFEMLVGEAYRLQGHLVAENTRGGPDGGIDLTLTKGRETTLVQCKQWKAYKVGVGVVRELYGVMAATGATGGVVVTSGQFTDDAKAFADGRNVQLVDGPKLFAMIKQTRQFQAAESHAANGVQIAALTRSAIPARCPQCGSGMVKRSARTGVNAGQEFLGCSKFPACRGSRQIS